MRYWEACEAGDSGRGDRGVPEARHHGNCERSRRLADRQGSVGKVFPTATGEFYNGDVLGFLGH